MAIQGISGIPNSAILSTINQSAASTPKTKDEDLVASKLGSLQNSEVGATDLITASLSAVTGKDTSAQMGRYTDLCTSLLSQQAKSANGLASYYDASGTSVSYTSAAAIIDISIGIEFSQKDLEKMQGMTSADAAESISEDGYWGANAVASRIMDMAVSLSDGDTEKIDLLQEAVMKGFDNAYAMMGGEDKAPSITQQTKEEIQKRFDYWRENGSLEGYSATETEDED